jgi:hypothetical protein
MGVKTWASNIPKEGSDRKWNMDQFEHLLPFPHPIIPFTRTNGNFS